MIATKYIYIKFLYTQKSQKTKMKSYCSYYLFLFDTNLYYAYQFMVSLSSVTQDMFVIIRLVMFN